jgi:DNA-binding CsgD family transcriptional regulator
VAAVFSPQNPKASSLLPAFQQLLKEHPVCNYWQRSGKHDIATRWSDVAEQPAIERLPLYDEFYRPLGVRHQMMVAVDAKPSHLIYVALNRSKTPFTEQDRGLLTAIQPHASQALQSMLRMHQLQSTIASYSTFVDTLSHGIICLSPGLQIRWASKRARSDLHTHFGWPANSRRLPTELQQRLTQAHKTDASALRALSFQSRAGSLIVRTLKKQKDVYLFLQSIEQQHQFHPLKTFGLTDRETEVLGWVARGKSNEETAAILGMGQQTVKKHLEHIYSVLGVANRTEAALKVHAALGEPAQSDCNQLLVP